MRSVGCSVAVAMAWTIVGGTAFAQGAMDLNGWFHSAPLPAPIADQGAFTRADSGDFDGDGRADAVVLEGARAIVLFTPGDALAPLALQGPHFGVCALRDAAAVQDELALSTPAGIVLARYDAQAGGFVESFALGGAWAGARELRSADLDGDGDADLMGISADRASVRVARRDSNTWVVGAELTSIGAALDVVALRWDLDAELEFAVLGEQGLSVYDHDGVLLRSWSAALAGGAIERVEQSGASCDRLAWITAYAPPEVQWLKTISPDGAMELVDLGDLAAYAASGADFDGDGDSDLLISPRFQTGLLWLENLRSPSAPGGETFSVTTQSARVIATEDAVFAAPSIERLAWPAVADFDGDGDSDFVLGVEPTRSITLRLGDWVDENEQRLALESAHYDTELHHLTVEARAPEGSPAATHWVVDVWRADSIASPLDPVAVQTLELTAPANGHASFDIAVSEATTVFDAVYRARIQPATLDAQGALRPCSAPTIFAFAVKASASDVLEAEISVDAVLAVQGSLPEDTTVRSRLTRSRQVLGQEGGAPLSHAALPN